MLRAFTLHTCSRWSPPGCRSTPSPLHTWRWSPLVCRSTPSPFHTCSGSISLKSTSRRHICCSQRSNRRRKGSDDVPGIRATDPVEVLVEAEGLRRGVTLCDSVVRGGGSALTSRQMSTVGRYSSQRVQLGSVVAPHMYGSASHASDGSGSHGALPASHL